MDVPKAGEMRGQAGARRRTFAAKVDLGQRDKKRDGLSSKIERFGASHTNKVQKL